MKEYRDNKTSWFIHSFIYGWIYIVVAYAAVPADVVRFISHVTFECEHKYSILFSSISHSVTALKSQSGRTPSASLVTEIVRILSASVVGRSHCWCCMFGIECAVALIATNWTSLIRRLEWHEHRSRTQFQRSGRHYPSSLHRTNCDVSRW